MVLSLTFPLFRESNTHCLRRWAANHFTCVFILSSVKSNLHLANICRHPSLFFPPSHSVLPAGRTSKWHPAMRVKGVGVALSVTRLPFRLSVIRERKRVAVEPLFLFFLPPPAIFAMPRRQKWSRQMRRQRGRNEFSTQVLAGHGLRLSRRGNFFYGFLACLLLGWKVRAAHS